MPFRLRYDPATLPVRNDVGGGALAEVSWAKVMTHSGQGWARMRGPADLMVV